MTPREIILEQIRHRETKPVPYTLGIEEDVAQRLDGHYGGTEWRGRLRPYMANVAAVTNLRQVPIDSVYARDDYGGLWRMDRRPFHLERPPLPEPSLEGYAFPPPERFFHPEAKEQARRTCEQNPHLFRVGHLGWGLFETSWGMRGFENILADSVAEPAFYEELLDRLTDLFLAFVDYTADLPVDAIMFGDDWGDQRGVILGPERWRRSMKPRWARIYEAVHARGKLVLTHCCGSVAGIMPDLVDIGLDVLESVQPEAAGMSPYDLKRRWGDHLTFWGGLGSQSTIPFGRPDSIRAEVRRLRAEVGRGGGYILSPAKPLQPETPTANAAAVVEAFTEED